MKKKELKMKVLCYNVYRLVKLGFGDFLFLCFGEVWWRVSMGPVKIREFTSCPISRLYHLT